MNQPGQVEQVDVAEAARRLGEGAGAAGAEPLLVDVRERDEFSAVRVPGAVLVPLSEFATRAAELPRDRPLLLMCAAGRRSMVAADFLAGQGYAQVANVEGGIGAWQRAGLEVRSGTPDPGEGELERG